MPTSIETVIVSGPWRSQYKVSGQTLAVNVAQVAQMNEVSVSEAMQQMLSTEVVGSPSIQEFWCLQVQGLTPVQRVLVAEEAMSLEDPFEMFDGQM